MDQAVILYSLFGPFLVWPLEYFLPYPYIIEELFKWILVLFFAKKSATPFFYAGIAFALSETILYSININELGSIGLPFIRFVLTSALHSLTFFIIYWFTQKSRKISFLGFILAVSIHFLYNRYVSTY